VVRTTLYCRQDGHDKVYQVWTTWEDDAIYGRGWLVRFAYGRRGKALVEGVKGRAVSTEVSADYIANRLVNEKRAKGYSVGDPLPHLLVPQRECNRPPGETPQASVAGRARASKAKVEAVPPPKPPPPSKKEVEDMTFTGGSRSFDF
jgi:hypothetical protein